MENEDSNPPIQLKFIDVQFLQMLNAGGTELAHIRSWSMAPF